MLPELLLVMVGALLVLVPGAAVVLAVRSDRLGGALRAELDAKLRDVDAGLARIEAEAGRTAAALREEAGRARAEERDALQALRSAVGDLANAQAERHASAVAALSNLKADAADDVRKLRDELRAALTQLGDALEAQLATSRSEAAAGTRALADDMGTSVKIAADALTQSLQLAIQQLTEAQRERFDAQGRLIEALSQGIESQHAALRQAVEARLDALQAEGSEKLADMQRAIDGELQSARDARLFDSVKRVSESLDQVHKAVGEMQSIASGTTLRAIPHSFDSSR
jgi:DNA recombination protein RmuC